MDHEAGHRCARLLDVAPGARWGGGGPPPDHPRRAPHALARRGSSGAALTAVLLGVGGGGCRGTSLRRAPPASRADPEQGVQEQVQAQDFQNKIQTQAVAEGLRKIAAGTTSFVCQIGQADCPNLLARFRETEENVKIGTFNILVESLLQTGNVTKGQAGNYGSRLIWLLKQEVSKVIKCIYRRLGAKSIKAKVQAQDLQNKIQTQAVAEGFRKIAAGTTSFVCQIGQADCPSLLACFTVTEEDVKMGTFSMLVELLRQTGNATKGKCDTDGSRLMCLLKKEVSKVVMSTQ